MGSNLKGGGTREERGEREKGKKGEREREREMEIAQHPSIAGG